MLNHTLAISDIFLSFLILLPLQFLTYHRQVFLEATRPPSMKRNNLDCLFYPRIPQHSTHIPHSRETASTAHTAQSSVAPVKQYAATQTDRVALANSATQTSLVDNATQTIFDHPRIRSLAKAPMQPNIPTAAPSNPTTNPAATTQIVPVIEPDTDSTDEAYAESTTRSYPTSIMSGISKEIFGEWKAILQLW
jgi:hypothetical protein